MTNESENSETDRQNNPLPVNPEEAPPEENPEKKPDRAEPALTAPVAEPRPSAPKKFPFKAIAGSLVAVTVIGLSVAVYKLAEERSHALREIQEKLGRMESQLQDLRNRQDAFAQSARIAENLQKELRAFREETNARFSAEENVLREFQNARQQTDGTEKTEAARKSENMTEPPEPSPHETPGDGATEVRSYLDFIEFLAKKAGDLLLEGFRKLWDFVSEFLK